MNLKTVSLDSPTLGPRLGAQTWNATLYELAPGEATAAYHYKWCREEWALVVSGAPTLRHADGQTLLSAGDICCFPQGPTGAHRLRNDSDEPARLVIFSTATNRPMSAFYPDDGTVLISISDREAVALPVRRPHRGLLGRRAREWSPSRARLDGARGLADGDPDQRPERDVRDRVGHRAEHDPALPDRLPATRREKAATRIGFVTAAASAYQRSDPRSTHAIGCRISRLPRMPSRRFVTRVPFPATQLSQLRSSHVQQAVMRAITASVTAT